jgi:hypothetical protein
MNGQLCWCFPFRSMLGEGWFLYSFALGMACEEANGNAERAHTHTTSVS